MPKVTGCKELTNSTMLRGDEGQVESKVKVKPCLEGRIRRRLTVWHKVWSVFELWIAKRIIIVHLDIIHHLLRTLQSGCKKYKHSHYNTCVCLPHSLISYPFIFCSYIFRHAHTHTHYHSFNTIFIALYWSTKYPAIFILFILHD